jgi:hypothetical protein
VGVGVQCVYIRLCSFGVLFFYACTHCCGVFLIVNLVTKERRKKRVLYLRSSMLCTKQRLSVKGGYMQPRLRAWFRFMPS